MNKIAFKLYIKFKKKEILDSRSLVRNDIF